jgi:putative ABC transport system substrate-binding protein
VKRREFISLIGSAAAVWPLASRAQQPAMPVVGFLSTGSPAMAEPIVAAFRQGLNEIGYVEGHNVTLEFRWALGDSDRISGLAIELIGRQVNVIFTPDSAASVAAKAATATIPIVFQVGGDPVKLGLVASLNRPGGNVTGVSQFANVLEGKRLELLHELVPAAKTIGFLVNPASPNADSQLRDVQEASRAIGLGLYVLKVSGEPDFDSAFMRLVQQRIGALILSADPMFFSRRAQLVRLAARYTIPTIYSFREFAAAGGLMSYGNSVTDACRRRKLTPGHRRRDLASLGQHEIVGRDQNRIGARPVQPNEGALDLITVVDLNQLEDDAQLFRRAASCFLSCFACHIGLAR